MAKHSVSIVISIIIFAQSFAQTPVGTWREHLPYNNAKVIAVTPSRVYCATNLALFYYNKTDYSLNTLSKINLLSDLEPGYIAYSDKHEKLIIGYTNGNIDILINDSKYNFPDIKEKSIIADKSINHILIYDDFALLSTGFGIIKFNLQKNEFTDSYIIGDGGSYLKVNSTAIFNDTIYALTDNGIKKAFLNNPFLGNHENWNNEENILNPNSRFYSSVVFNNKLFIVNELQKEDSCHINIYDGHMWDTIPNLNNIKSLSSSEQYLVVTRASIINIFDTSLTQVKNDWISNIEYAVYNDHKLWMASSKEGLVLYDENHNDEPIIPNGPSSNIIFNIYNNNGSILVARGGYNTRIGERSYTWPEIYSFTDETWTNFTDDKDNVTQTKSMRDVVDFAAQNNPNKYMVGTWFYGLFEVENNKVTHIYNSENTNGVLGNVIGGMTYDDYGNLYVVCNYTDYPFVVKTPDNKWYKYKYDGIWGDLVYNASRKLINTFNNDKWTISTRGKGIYVYNDNRTPEYEADDTYTQFDLRDETSVIDQQLNDIVQDVEGAIWIATSSGVAVYDYPEYALREDKTMYARIPQLVVEGYLKGLLEGENVTCIAVDGANRKWLGTEGGGLFLVSDDGTQQLISLNTDNSKLFSNNIISVAINQANGEVFIGTDKGLQSYKSTSTENKENYNEIYAFPNPVKGDYNGLITVRGLMYNTNVKITDMAGRLVFETLSNGGDAIWNGHDMSGNKVAAGVYLVLCSNPDGSESEATKILIVN